jgi:hypothetical protein
MSDSQNKNLMIILIVVVALAIIGALLIKKKQKEPYTAEYLKNVAITSGSPVPDVIYGQPSFKASVDPRFESQGVSSLRSGAGSPDSQQGFPTTGGAMYSAEEMINLGGCAKVCGEGNVCKKMNCPYGDKYSEWATGSEPLAMEPSLTMKSTGGSMSSDKKAFDLAGLKALEDGVGRFGKYQNAVKAEEMLPKPDIAANVDPSQYVVYDRNMGSMMMKSGNRTPVDFIRGDVIPVTRNCTPTISARIGDPDSPQFVPRFASDIGTLSRGYFTNYNDVVQVLEERNASYFMSKAQALRNELRQDSGMSA